MLLFWVGATGVCRFASSTSASTAASAFFHVAILDEKFYDRRWRRALVDGGDVSVTSIRASGRWGYPFFLAASPSGSAAGGDTCWRSPSSTFSASLTAVLVADARHPPLPTGRAAGALAGGLYVLAGPPLFFEGELLITSLFTFLATASALGPESR